MIDSLEVVLEHMLKGAGWALLIFVILFLIWLSPIGKLIDEFEEFQKWKRDRGAKISPSPEHPPHYDAMMRQAEHTQQFLEERERQESAKLPPDETGVH